MPGAPSIKWTDANMVQALHALIGYGAVKIEDDVAQKVADHLGNGCTTTAIHNLIRTRKSSFKPGIKPIADGEDAPAPKRKRKAAAETTGKGAKKPRKTPKKNAKKDLSDAEDDDEYDGEDGPVTPPLSARKESSTYEVAGDNYDSLDVNIKNEEMEAGDIDDEVFHDAESQL